MKPYRITLAVLGLAALNGAAVLTMSWMNKDGDPHAVVSDSGLRQRTEGNSL